MGQFRLEASRRLAWQAVYSGELVRGFQGQELSKVASAYQLVYKANESLERLKPAAKRRKPMSVRTAARVVQQARLLDYGEAAAYLGMSEWQLRKRVAKGEVSKARYRRCRYRHPMAGASHAARGSTFANSTASSTAGRRCCDDETARREQVQAPRRAGADT